MYALSDADLPVVRGLAPRGLDRPLDVQFITQLPDAISVLCEHTRRVTVAVMPRSLRSDAPRPGRPSVQLCVFDLRDWILDADVRLRYTDDVTAQSVCDAPASDPRRPYTMDQKRGFCA